MHRFPVMVGRFVLGTVLLILLAAPVFGQDLASLDADAALDAERERALQYADPQSLDQERWQSAVYARIRVLQELIRLRSDRASLPDAGAVADWQRRARSSLDSLRALPGPGTVRLEHPDELVAVERALVESETAREVANAAKAELDARIGRERAERSALPGRASEVQSRLAALEGDEPLDAYRRETWQLELQVIAARLDHLSGAVPIRESLVPVFETERAVATLAYEHARTRATEAREQAALLRERDVAEQLREAQAWAREADAAADPLEGFRLTMQSEAAEATARTGLVRSQATRIAGQLTTEKDLLAGNQAMKERLEVRVSLGAAGSGGALRQLLRRIREIEVQIEDVARPVVTARLEQNQAELVGVLDRIWMLQVPSSVNETLAQLLAAAGPEKEAQARASFEAMTRGEGGVLPALRDLQDALNDVVRADAELLDLMDQRVAILAETQGFVRRGLLWSRSLPPLSFDALRTIAGELSALRDVSPPVDALESMRSRPRFTALVVAIALLGIAGSLWGRRWKAPVPEDSEVAPVNYDLAFVQRLIRGVAWAGGYSLAAFIVALWYDTAESGPLRPPFALLFSGIGWLLLIGRSAALVLDPGGFLNRQLTGSRSAAARVLRAVRVLTTSGIFLLAPALVSAEPPYALERLPQILTVAWMLTLALVFLRGLSTSSPIIEQWTVAGSTSRRLLVALGVLVPLLSLLLVIFDLMGYRAGAEALFGNMLRLIAALLILLVLYRIIEGTSHRISRAVSRRIIRERGWKEAAEAESKIESFIRRTAATFAIVIVALVLRDAWNIGDTLGEMLAGWQLFDTGDGEWLTMLNVVDAIVLLVLGLVISQSLTKTWELVIAPLRGNEVAGSAYATLTMLRYLVLGIAVAAALLTLKFSLARLGWLLTALSVGLGFGLQEIVANFVSGLILMIERPVRVGDVVTVGTTAGVVDKISIRATMVTNWDRQTIVVPNRNFITQEVTNWTRQDRVVRRTLQVGVAYGTDVERVLAILDELVGAHPKVLRTPPHRIWFHGFGESSLDFEVWFYATFDDGLVTRSELYTLIYARLNEEGIQIPFPQRDVWVRDSASAADLPAEFPDAPAPGARPTSP